MNREQYERVLSGMALTASFVRTLPGDSLEDRVARANAMVEGLRIAKVPTWRPVFPFAGGIS